jgi:predicted DNA-binding protein (MmcQ/YjbR family)
MPRTKLSTDALLRELRAFGLAYPGAHTKSPWEGHLDLAVNDKTFAYLSVDGAPFSISCKLPHSCGVALMFPFAKPTAYGLGKSGWVTASFPDGTMPPVSLFKEWIDESYRAQAPKKLVAGLGQSPAATKPAQKPPRPRTPSTASADANGQAKAKAKANASANAKASAEAKANAKRLAKPTAKPATPSKAKTAKTTKRKTAKRTGGARSAR